MRPPLSYDQACFLLYVFYPEKYISTIDQRQLFLFSNIKVKTNKTKVTKVPRLLGSSFSILLARHFITNPQKLKEPTKKTNKIAQVQDEQNNCWVALLIFPINGKTGLKLKRNLLYAQNWIKRCRSILWISFHRKQ